MAEISVTINPQGKPSPKYIKINAGDIVTFRARGTEVLLCFRDLTIFGTNDLYIPKNTDADVTVQDRAKKGPFKYTIIAGNPDARCPQGGGTGSGGEGGGGEVGGGDMD